MQDINFLQKLKIWLRVYQRIRFFKRMYPLSAIIADIFLFPLDYFFNRRRITAVRNVTLAITHRCNMRCAMCYFNKKLDIECDLPLSLYKRVIDSVKKSRPCIILSGGEPFLHPHLINMVDYAKSLGLAVQIFTNGTLITPSLTEALVKAKLDYINFSLLGNEVSHSLVTNTPDAYGRFINNLEYFAARRQGTKIILNYTITPDGIKDIGHALKLAMRYKLDGLRIQHYNFLSPSDFRKQAGRMEAVFQAGPLVNEIEGPKEFNNLAAEVIDFKKRLSRDSKGIPIQWAPDLSNAEIRNWYSDEEFNTGRKCLFPWRGILVDADGKIYPCSKIYLPCGDIKKQDLFKAWNSQDMQKFRKALKKNLFPACSRCCKL